MSSSTDPETASTTVEKGPESYFGVDITQQKPTQNDNSRKRNDSDRLMVPNTDNGSDEDSLRSMAEDANDDDERDGIALVKSATRQSVKKVMQFMSPMDCFETIEKEFEEQGDGETREGLTKQEQEEEQDAYDEKTGPRRRYWYPKNIMHIEDTPYSRRINVTLLMLTFSYLGNLARISFQQLLTYDNAYIYYNAGTMIWVNFTSCVIMGFADNATGMWAALSQGSKRKLSLKQIPLHTAIVAGFCGCFSTFSGVMSELVFLTINGSLPTPNNGYGVMQFFAVLFTQVGLCVFGIQFGADIAFGVDYWVIPYVKPYLDIKLCRTVEYAIIVMGFAATVVNIVLSIVFNYDDWYKRDYSIALLFGLFGCHARFKMMELNGRVFQKWFPTGTFLVNFIACLLLAVLNLLRHGYKNKTVKLLIITNPAHKCIINAFANGFCGSLSTFAALCTELMNMGNPHYRYIYFLVTFLCCFIPTFLILASFKWTEGMAIV